MSCPSPRSRSRSAAIALALTLTLSGCAADAHLDNRHSGTTESTSTPSSSAAPTSPFDPTIRNAPPTNVDYAALLLQASDLSSTDDTFALRSAKQDPSGLPGASALFVNADDTRAISVTVARYPDAAVAIPGHWRWVPVGPSSKAAPRTVRRPSPWCCSRRTTSWPGWSSTVPPATPRPTGSSPISPGCNRSHCEWVSPAVRIDRGSVGDLRHIVSQVDTVALRNEAAKL